MLCAPAEENTMHTETVEEHGIVVENGLEILLESTHEGLFTQLIFTKLDLEPNNYNRMIYRSKITIWFVKFIKSAMFVLLFNSCCICEQKE